MNMYFVSQFSQIVKRFINLGINSKELLFFFSPSMNSGDVSSLFIVSHSSLGNSELEWRT